MHAHQHTSNHTSSLSPSYAHIHTHLNSSMCSHPCPHAQTHTHGHTHKLTHIQAFSISHQHTFAVQQIGKRGIDKVSEWQVCGKGSGDTRTDYAEIKLGIVSNHGLPRHGVSVPRKTIGLLGAFVSSKKLQGWSGWWGAEVTRGGWLAHGLLGGKQLSERRFFLIAKSPRKIRSQNI